MENKSDRRTYMPSLLHSWCRGPPIPVLCSWVAQVQGSKHFIFTGQGSPNCSGFPGSQANIFLKRGERQRQKKTLTRHVLIRKKGKKLQCRESQPRFPLKKHCCCLLGICLLGNCWKLRNKEKRPLSHQHPHHRTLPCWWTRPRNISWGLTPGLAFLSRNSNRLGGAVYSWAANLKTAGLGMAGLVQQASKGSEDLSCSGPFSAE